MSSSDSERMLKLKSSDGVTFDIKDAIVVTKLEFIKNIIEDCCGDNDLILVPNVNSQILAMVLEWCKKHVGDDIISDGEEDEENEYFSRKKEIKKWDAEFVKNLDQGVLYHLLMAADYLNAKQLLDLLTQRVADMIKGKKSEQIRQIFNIKNDFTPEEEEAIKKRNPWAFE
ncbi:hypothetical protein UlMin_022689 [Ulmus minor]